jgi:hypothetical protein
VATDVAVGNVEEVRIVLGPPGVIDGRIVTAAQGPVPGELRVASVQTWLDLSPLYPQEERAVAPDGQFQLREAIGQNGFEVKGLPPGWQVLRVLHQDRPADNNRIVVLPGERVDRVDVVVGPAP